MAKVQTTQRHVVTFTEDDVARILTDYCLKRWEHTDGLERTDVKFTVFPLIAVITFERDELEGVLR